MSVPRLFVLPERFEGDTVRIAGPDHFHLTRVLRAHPGDSIHLLDNLGNAFQAILVTVEKGETIARTIGRVAVAAEPSVFIAVAQAVGKGDKLEQVIQHGIEVGASAFLPIRADRSVVDLPPARIAERLTRWRQIAKGAAEQSGRVLIPEIYEPGRLVDVLALADTYDGVLLCHAGSGSARPLASTLAERALVAHPPRRLLLAVGPEGGWSPAELQTARDAGAAIVTLGPRTLRTETAAIVAVSQILYHYERN